MSEGDKQPVKAKGTFLPWVVGGFLVLVILVHLAGLMLLGLSMGPPNYEGDSKKYLLKHHYSQDVVDALLEYKPFKPDMVAQLIRLPSVDVRHMLAKNPWLTPADRQILLRDKNVYVRQGVARNFRLSHEEMEMILRDQPAPVLMGLARNPAVPREMLLQVFDKLLQEYGDYNSGYLDFAYNPYCPQEIIEKINRGEDDLYRSIVQHTQKCKEQFKQSRIKGELFLDPETGKPYNNYIWRQPDLWWRDEE